MKGIFCKYPCGCNLKKKVGWFRLFKIKIKEERKTIEEIKKLQFQSSRNHQQLD